MQPLRRRGPAADPSAELPGVRAETHRSIQGKARRCATRRGSPESSGRWDGSSAAESVASTGGSDPAVGPTAAWRSGVFRCPRRGAVCAPCATGSRCSGASAGSTGFPGSAVLHPPPGYGVAVRRAGCPGSAVGSGRSARTAGASCPCSYRLPGFTRAGRARLVRGSPDTASAAGRTGGLGTPGSTPGAALLAALHAARASGPRRTHRAVRTYRARSAAGIAASGGCAGTSGSAPGSPTAVDACQAGCGAGRTRRAGVRGAHTCSPAQASCTIIPSQSCTAGTRIS